MDVLVIGAGVCGLTTGICLAEAGLGVTIRAAVPPERTTSVAAGAVWGLVRVGPPDRVLDWGRTGLEVLSKLAAEPGLGQADPCCQAADPGPDHENVHAPTVSFAGRAKEVVMGPFTPGAGGPG